MKLLVVVLSLIQAPAPAPSNTKWCGPLPIAIKLDPRIPPSVAPDIVLGMLSWNRLGLGELVRPATAADPDPVTIRWVPAGDELCGVAPGTVETGLPCTVGRDIFVYAHCSAFLGSPMGIVVHELGHILGLEHSTDPNSVMFPQILGPKQNFTPADIENMRKRYGK